MSDGDGVGLECAGCGGRIDPREDTHYRVGEETRPLPLLEKDRDELEPGDYFSRNWFLCLECAGGVIDLDQEL